MVRRKVAENSDSESIMVKEVSVEEDYEQSPKKAKLEENSVKAKNNTKSKRKRMVGDESDENEVGENEVGGNEVGGNEVGENEVGGNDVEGVDNNSDIDEEQEKRIFELLQERMRANTAQLKFRESGTIKCIELVNFMCHSHWKGDFINAVNFIIGNNGSGKSTVLTAITVALGGRANLTNRAKSVSELIKSGCHSATIRITLLNKGEDPYKPEVYGDYIIVERRLVRDGGATFKIMNQAGKTISTRRDEILAICDFWSIQVDNPLCVLNQDAARQFLQDSTDDKRYQFFMRATHLDQLSSDYSSIKEKLQQMDSSMKLHKEALREVKDEYHEVNEKLERMGDIQVMNANRDKLSKELIWCIVNEKKQICDSKREKMERIELEKERGEKESETQKELLAEYDEEIATLEARKAELQNQFQPVDDMHRTCHNQARNAKFKLQKIEEEKIDLERDIEANVKKLQDTELLISQTTEKENESTQQFATMKAERLAAFDQKLKSLNLDYDKLSQEKSTLRSQRENFNRNLQVAKNEKRRLAESIASDKDYLNRLEMSAEDKVSMYGADMRNMINGIRNDRGAYLSVRDKKWADAIQAVVGKLLPNFVVHDHHDRARLMGYFNKFKHFSGIYVRDYDSGPLRSNKLPDSKYLSFMQVLKVDDQIVMDVLKINANIETVILFETREQAQRCLDVERPINVDYALVQNCYKLQNYGKGSSSATYLNRDGRYRLDADLASQKQAANKKIADAEYALEIVERDIKKMMDSNIDADIKRLDKDLSQINAGISNVQMDMRNLEMEIPDNEPIDMAILLSEKQEIAEDLSNKKRQMANMIARLQETAEEYAALDAEFINLQNQKSDCVKQTQLLQNTIDKTKGERVRQNMKYQSFRSVIATELGKLRTLKEDLERAEEDYQDCRSKASEHCGQEIITKKSKEAIEEMIRELDIRIEQNEAVSGRYDETLEKFNKLSSKLSEYQKMYKKGKYLKRMMSDAIVLRGRKILDLRKYIAVRAKISFNQYLQERQYDGKLEFHHDKQKLCLQIKTTEQELTAKGNQRKDTKSLSGGEKSFSTVAFFLSLWEAIESPIRCLDEFDVFMDAVNRKTSIRQIVQFSETHPTQYVLITPQDMSVIPKDRENVAVIRMNDPERSQQ